MINYISECFIQLNKLGCLPIDLYGFVSFMALPVIDLVKENKLSYAGLIYLT